MQRLIGDVKLELAFQDVEGLILPGVDVGWQIGSGRVEAVQKRERSSALLAAGLDQELDAAEDA
jgi:hypothetical protein